MKSNPNNCAYLYKLNTSLQTWLKVSYKQLVLLSGKFHSDVFFEMVYWCAYISLSCRFIWSCAFKVLSGQATEIRIISWLNDIACVYLWIPTFFHGVLLNICICIYALLNGMLMYIFGFSYLEETFMWSALMSTLFILPSLLTEVDDIFMVLYGKGYTWDFMQFNKMCVFTVLVLQDNHHNLFSVTS